MSYRLDLIVHKTKKPDMPSNPYVEIYVKTFSQNDERILVSSECYSMQEIDEAIQIIMNDLEEIRKKAKKELK